MIKIFLFCQCFAALLIFGNGALPPLKRTNKDVGSLRFLVMGDWGGLPDFPFRTPIERAVGKQMGKIADYLDAHFTLALGDNFYFSGVKDVDDKRFQESFEDVFTASSLMRPWYLVAGNHDWNGNVSAQINYSKKSARWNFPHYYYPLSFPVPGSKAMKVDILMIDTVMLCGNSDSDTLKLQPQFPEDPKSADEQLAWIEQTLKNSKADYLLVAGHYPVYSVAEHGPTKCLVQNLEPMLHKYRASAYLCGHEHNIQHLEYTDTMYKSTVNYFVSGAANFIDPEVSHTADVPAGSLRFHWGDILSLGSFSFVELSQNNMTYTFLEASGKVLYQKVLLPRKQ